jgi:hypothetical protein
MSDELVALGSFDGSLTMHIEDFEGETEVFSEESLLERLQSVRREEFGAFILSHTNQFPALSVQFNGSIAYLHYFLSEHDHPGFQARGMDPDDCPESLDFLQTKGSMADSFTMPRDTLVSEDVAYTAAIEFFHSSELPPSVSWFEL